MAHFVTSIRTAVEPGWRTAPPRRRVRPHLDVGDIGVTDMSLLFCGDPHDHSGVGYCNTAAASFNEDIGAWGARVTRMYGMFWYASSFNQNIGGWSVENV